MGRGGIIHGEHDSNGKACGVGYWVYNDGNAIYKGTFKNGKIHGYGVYYTPSDSQEGEWREGRPHGNSTYRE